MNLSLDELDMLRGIIRFYLSNQSFPRDKELHAVQNLYDEVSSYIPNKSLGEMMEEYANAPTEEFGKRQPGETCAYEWRYDSDGKRIRQPTVG